mgnify:CR=1 FL=1
MAKVVAAHGGGEGAALMPFGFLAYVSVGVSIFFCYLQILIDLLLPLVSLQPLQIDIHIQAVLMWGFALLALWALYRDKRSYESSLPFLLGLIGFSIILATLYTFYDVRILILGYLFMVAAVILNPAALLTGLNRSVREQASELATLNGTLESRVESQVAEIERLARLKRFLSSEVVEMITTEDKETLLDSHRCLVACLFCDIRNFTGFSEAAEPEEVMDVLQSLHSQMGHLVAEHGGTIGYRAGDGLMIIFNDPLPCEAPVLRAAALAVAIRESFETVRQQWRKLGHELGLGLGIAYGYATLGLIGSEGRYDYTAIGKVVNIAARLCDRAGHGEILIDRRGFVEIEGESITEALGALELKGLEKPIEAYRITQVTTLSSASP